MNRPHERPGRRPGPRHDLGLTLGTLAGLGVAALVAWRLGGAAGTGVLAGYLVAAFLSAIGAAWQAHALRTAPQRVMNAVVGMFLAKLAVLLIAAATFRYVEPAGRHVDWRSFLVAFAAGVMLVVALGSLGTWKTLKGTRSVA